MVSKKSVLRLALFGSAALARHYWMRRRKIDFRGKTVVITGGARGLGLELARRFCREGARVAICARSPRDVGVALGELRRANENVVGETCDVRDPEQIARFLDRVRRDLGPIDVLVNNAGVIQVGPEEHMSALDYQGSLDAHFWGPWNAINAVVPEMKRRGCGRIVNIASIGGKISVPHLLPYCTGKFALVGYSSGLRSALRRDGIVVTTVCPGLMRTGSARHALFKGRNRAEYAWFSIGASLPGITIGSRRAARKIVEACRRGKPEVVLTIPAKLAVRLQALFPQLTAAALELVAATLPTAGGRGGLPTTGAASTSAWSPSWLTVLNERAAVRNLETY